MPNQVSNQKETPKEDPCVLALDQGSQSTRAMLYSWSGEKLFSWQTSIAVHDQGRHVEHEPEEILQSCKDGIAAAQEYAGRNRLMMSALGLSVQRSAALLVDEHGKAQTRLLSWRDTRSEAVIQALSDAAKQEIYEEGGIPASVHFLAAKWKELLQAGSKNTFPLSLDGYLLLHLTKNTQRRICATMAQRSMLYNLPQNSWSKKLCDVFTFPMHILPEIRPDIGNWDHISGIPLRALIGDQQAACMASEGFGAQGLLNLGSIGSCMIPQETALPRTQGFLHNLLCLTEAGTAKYALEATCPSPLPLFQYIQTRFSRNPKQASAAWESAMSSPDYAPAILFAPFGGVSTPEWKSDLPFLSYHKEATFSDTDILCGLLENLLFSLSFQVLELQKQSSQKIQSLLCGGGYSHIEPLVQGIGFLTGLRIFLTHDTELSALGAAQLALGKIFVTPDAQQLQKLPASSFPWTSVQERFFLWRKMREDILQGFAGKYTPGARASRLAKSSIKES